MACSVNKRLLIVVFFVLCFISFQATERTLKERSDDNKGMTEVTINNAGHDEKGRGDHQTLFKPKVKNNEAKKSEGHEVFSMDYTPASRKPPIHN